jgi:hypothetical protein
MEKYNFLKNSFIFPLENKDCPEHQARRLSAGFFEELPLWKIKIPSVKHTRGILGTRCRQWISENTYFGFG